MYIVGWGIAHARASSFYHVDSKDRADIARLSNQALLPLGQLSALSYCGEYVNQFM